VCNSSPQNAVELNQRVFAEMIQVQTDQELLGALFHASDLPVPRALFS
jgi:hypothetical protein